MDNSTFEKPFPALTPAERYHLDVFGYVIIENTLTADEVGRIKKALYDLRQEIKQLDHSSPTPPRVRDSFFETNKPHHHFIVNILEAHPDITAYATHPRLVAMCEELMGGEARIVEMNAHINSRDPDADPTPKPQYGFHRGTDIAFAGHSQNGLFHCNFVKTLTNLTELGPDDGGTVVIAGSHKIEIPSEGLIKLAYEDRSLIHQVVAPAGSTLLFSETLIHATGQIRSEEERVIIITGYGSTMFPYWDNGTLSEGFRDQIPDQLQTLFHGKAHWTRGPRYRRLSEEADDRVFALGHWADRSSLSNDE